MRFIAALALTLCTLVACGASAPTPPITPPGLAFSYTDNPPTPESFVPEVVPVWISSAFVQDEKDAIESAMAEWNTALNGYYRFTLEDASYSVSEDGGSAETSIENTYQGLLVTRVTPKDADETAGEGVLAWVDGLRGHGMHVVADRIGTRNLHTVILHELGHVVGIPHALVKGTLMAPGYPYNAPCIDKIAVMQVASMRSEMNWRYMNWCNWPR